MGEILLITKKEYNLQNVVISSSVLKSDYENIEYIVFNDCEETEADVSLQLSKLNGKKKFIYINKELNSFYYCLFAGLKADIYDTEDYLTDIELFKFIIDNHGNSDLVVKSPTLDLEALNRSIVSISNTNADKLRALVSNPLWLKTLNNSLTSVSNALTRSDEMTQKVIRVFEEASARLELIKQSHDSVGKQLEEANRNLQEYEKKNASKNYAHNFGKFKVPFTVKKVLYIRVMGDCMFLRSFIFAYKHYLRMNKKIKTRVLFLAPKLSLFLKRFGDYPRLSKETLEVVEKSEKDYFVTYEPIKMVLNEFFVAGSQPDLFIVVDYLYSDVSIEGHCVETYYALTTGNDVELFGVPKERTIIPLFGFNEGVIMPFIPKILQTDSEVKRHNMYYSNCKRSFENLDKVLFID